MCLCLCWGRYKKGSMQANHSLPQSFFYHYLSPSHCPFIHRFSSNWGGGVGLEFWGVRWASLNDSWMRDRRLEKQMPANVKKNRRGVCLCDLFLLGWVCLSFIYQHLDCEWDLWQPGTQSPLTPSANQPKSFVFCHCIISRNPLFCLTVCSHSVYSDVFPIIAKLLLLSKNFD